MTGKIIFIACFTISSPLQDFDREKKKKIKQIFIFVDVTAMWWMDEK